MSVANIPLIETGSFELFCKNHPSEVPALFELSWALILHRFFETNCFLTVTEIRDSRDDCISKSGRTTFSTARSVEFTSELARETSTVNAFRSLLPLSNSDELEPEKRLRKGHRGTYDDSSQRVRTALVFRQAQTPIDEISLELKQV